MTTPANDSISLDPQIDLDETAELPMLPGSLAAAAADPLAATDAWVAPNFQLPRAFERESDAEVAPQLDSAQASAREAEIGALRSNLASVSESRSQLEHDLTSLGGNLRELEQLLNRKSEQLSVFEREVGLRDRRIGELEARIAQLDAAVATTGADAALEREELLAARAEAEAARLRQEALTADMAALKVERATLWQRAQAAEADLKQWRTRGERYRETLQSLEGRRQLYDGMVAEREARIAVLELQVASHDGKADAREQELRTALQNEQQRVRELDTTRSQLEASAATARERIAALETETRLQAATLGELRAHSGTREEQHALALRDAKDRNAELDAARARAEAAAAAARERIAALEAQTRLQEESLEKLRAESLARQDELGAALRAEQARSAELEAARAAAAASAAVGHERIALLEADARHQEESARELRKALAVVRESLAQRNALIERVEAEAASSVAMLGNIQHNLEQLGAAGETVHLLTRTEGETGIVHLLGRRTTIGRTADNDLRIDADFISRHHAVALRAAAHTIIEDLNSTNGTYVNGVRINRRALKDGDLVVLGKTEFRFVIKPPG